MTAVALLGTGLLGRAVAERLHETGHTVIAYNRTPTKALPLQRQGIAVVTAADLAISQTDCTLLFLTDAQAIRSTLLTPASSAALTGKTVVQMGTIGSSESLEIQQAVERCRGAYFEAPVLGSLAEAKAGTLFVMMGGTEQQFAAWAPLFRSLSREPRYIGPVGRASALKLALNQLIAAEMSAFALSLGLIQRSGVSIDTFMAVLRGSALFAPTFEKKLPRLLKRDYHHPNFSTRHLLKDLMLFLHEAAASGLSTEGVNGLPLILERAIASGLGDLDYSALFDVVNPPDSGSPRS